jgi:hypothetical protein
MQSLLVQAARGLAFRRHALSAPVRSRTLPCTGAQKRSFLPTKVPPRSTAGAVDCIVWGLEGSSAPMGGPGESMHASITPGVRGRPPSDEGAPNLSWLYPLPPGFRPLRRRSRPSGGVGRTVNVGEGEPQIGGGAEPSRPPDPLGPFDLEPRDETRSEGTGIAPRGPGRPLPMRVDVGGHARLGAPWPPRTAGTWIPAGPPARAPWRMQLEARGGECESSRYRWLRRSAHRGPGFEAHRPRKSPP